MAQLPERMARELQANTTVLWWGRRATFEIVEEVSESTFWSLIVAYLSYEAGEYFEMEWGWYVATFLVILLIWHHAIKEILQWWNEVYIVVTDNLNGGGRIYKFSGWPNYRYVNEVITQSTPTVSPSSPLLARLWGWITGEKMIKCELRSQNHAYIEGRKIHPNFVSAINRVRGTPKTIEPMTAGNLQNLAVLDQVRMTGLVDFRLARQAAHALVSRVFFGGE